MMYFRIDSFDVETGEEYSQVFPFSGEESVLDAIDSVAIVGGLRIIRTAMCGCVPLQVWQDDTRMLRRTFAYYAC
jgi:hypothetical protein